MEDNYIMFKGNKIELTEEQVKQLEEATKLKENSPYKLHLDENYYFINSFGKVVSDEPSICNYDIDFKRIDAGNACTNKKIATETAKQTVLFWLLRKFTIEHGWKDEMLYDDKIVKYYIYFGTKHWCVGSRINCVDLGIVNFVTSEITEQAIKEIVEPFYNGTSDICKIWEENK